MIKIDDEKCDMCGVCVDICPVEKIIFISRSEIGFNKEIECIDCQYCVSACHVRAITIKTDRYIERHPLGKVRFEISGKFKMLDGQKSCFVTDEVDVERIDELINACGCTVSSVLGRKLIIKIEEET